MAQATPPPGVLRQTESARVPYGLTARFGPAYSGRNRRGGAPGHPDAFYPIPDPLVAGEGFSSVHPEHNEWVQTRRAIYDQNAYQDFHVSRVEVPQSLQGPLPPRPGRKILFTRRREFLEGAQSFSGLHGSPHLERRVADSRGTIEPPRRPRLTRRAIPRSYSSVTQVRGRG